MPRLDRDSLHLIPSRTAAQRTIGVIDTTQDWPPHEQLVALAATFLLMCERYQSDPAEMLRLVERIINHSEGKLPEFSAVRDYLEKEF